jgi:hypothetical protein
MQKCLLQHCLPRAAVRDQGNVAKKLGGILFHEISPSYQDFIYRFYVHS